MAGGVWFLGQAVAQADQANNVGQENSQSSTSEDGGGITGNIGGNANFSSNEVEVDIETDVEGGDGGENYSNVNTGVQGAIIVAYSNDNSRVPVNSSSVPNGGNHGSSDAEVDIDITTGSVSVEQNANGGNVSGSGNVDLGGLKLPDQVNNVHQVNNQTATSEDDHHGRRPHDGDSMLRGMNGGHGGLTGNLGGNLNFSRNEVDIDIETDVEGGDGGYNDSNVNTGLQGVILACIAKHGGDADCDVDIETGHVSVVQNANGGNVSDSGNVGFGGRKDHDGHDARRHHGDKHGAEAKPAARPEARHHAAAPVSSAQPKGALAYTGSDVSLPLTAGLLALAAGIGLTAAGRRRQSLSS
jgi:hypothetical protein